MSEQNVQVTRADRDAARELSLVWVREGALGEFDIAQAFARHRTRAEPDLVEVLRPFADAGEYLLSETTGFVGDEKLWLMVQDECGKCHGLYDGLTFRDLERAALNRADV